MSLIVNKCSAFNRMGLLCRQWRMVNVLNLKDQYLIIKINSAIC